MIVNIRKANDTEMINENIEVPSSIYNPAYFQPEIIIKYLQIKNILKTMQICP